jgi:pimeloyl-ACP methyl ester carboxylesterase
VLRPLLKKTLSPILVEAGAGFDVAVVRIAQELAKRAPTRRQDVAERQAYLEGVGVAYASVDESQFYAAPPAIADLETERVRDIERGEVLDLTWTSGWTCAREDQRARFNKWRENNTVHARLFRHRDRAAPTIVCVHGYRAGTFSFEERAFGAQWLFNLGLDVALFTLPFHALRAPASRRATPLFPTADVARTNEAFGQAMWDLRRLVQHVRGRGAPHVGVMGMSLGGYTTALLATVESSLDFAVPYIPVSDLTDVVVEHEALRGTVVPRELVEAGKRSMALVRPLGRKPAIPGDRVLVVGAKGDRITRTSHAEALAQHFGSELTIFPGAHLLQFGRREAFAAIAKFLARRSVISPRK